MKKTTLIIAIAGVVLLGAAGGAAAWWKLRPQADAHGEAAAASAPPAVDKHPPKYVSLDKVIVMLRRSPGDPSAHYLALDLVLKTPEDKEKLTKEHLPLLRSVAVRAMSTYTLDKASGMTVEQLTEAVNLAFNDSYTADKHEKPFTEALIGKLVIE